MQVDIPFELAAPTPMTVNGSNESCLTFVRPAECNISAANANHSTCHACSRRGTCGADGLCACDPGTSGGACEMELQCAFWDRRARAWSTAGVDTALELQGSANVLACGASEGVDDGVLLRTASSFTLTLEGDLSSFGDAELRALGRELDGFYTEAFCAALPPAARA